MLRVRIAGSRALVDRRLAHLRHQPPHPTPANVMAVAAEVPDHLAAAVPGHVDERRIDDAPERSVSSVSGAGA